MPGDPLQKPRLALTLALAGKRDVPEAARAGLDAGLAAVFRAIGMRLDALLAEARSDDGGLVMRFRADAPARLTLVTGLADGADQIAADLFLPAEPEAPGLERILGAILPCGRADFVTMSAVADIARFERQAAACAFILELDGSMLARPADEETDPKARQARADRGQAFNAQSEVLLRHADILIAVDNPDTPGRVGGAQQTLSSAIDFGLPVVLLRLGHEGVAVLRTRADLDEPVMLPENAAAAALAHLVDSVIGVRQGARDPAYVNALLTEFYAAAMPTGDLRNWAGSRFRDAFSKGRNAASSPTAAPYHDYRERARGLSGHYSDQYRGSFLLGYGLVVAAVTMALLSLALLLSCPVWWGLLGLGLGKLGIVLAIAWLADSANHRRLAHRAADYRYLAERLRTMTFMPHVGSLRPPSPWSLPYTTRVASQGVMDRLFLSIVRQAPPLEAFGAGADGAVVRQDAKAALSTIRHGWLASQRLYHFNNQRTMAAMSHWLERAGRRLNRTVIAVVVVDLGILLLERGGWLAPVLSEPLHAYAAPTLIFLAAILPTAVAGLNGVRFQSECARLADRSEQMAVELGRLEERSDTPRPRPIRLMDALRLAEDVAKLTLDEVAEWSAIYGKEFVEM